MLLAICLASVPALVLAVLLALPLARPASTPSLNGSSTVDLTGLPRLSVFRARDRGRLGYRAYPPSTTARGVHDRAAILIHGSSASSVTMNALAKALAEAGVAVYVPDIRGHGQSGPRGDIAYIGQLEDDLEDLCTAIELAAPGRRITLVGHSAGGGFVARVAGSRLGERFERFVLLAPYLGFTSPSTRAVARWAKAAVPRVVALDILNDFGITTWNGLPALAFAIAPGSEQILTPVYSYRLMRNFAAHANYRHDLRAATRPVDILVGSCDELMNPGGYRHAVAGLGDRIHVHVVDGADHMGIVGESTVVYSLAANIAQAEPLQERLAHADHRRRGGQVS
jgi:alpha-beta hydrolase superfamily lysophospholipase